jgi:6-phosphogluconolactonase
VDLQAFVNHPLARRDFLIGVTGLAAVAASRWPAAASAAMWMYVGSFAGEGRGHGEGLSVFHRAGESDRWQRGLLLTDVADPSLVIVDRQRRCVYSAHGDGTQVTAYNRTTRT